MIAICLMLTCFRVRLAFAKDVVFSMYYSEYVPNLACS